jgi:striatin 1/3/4
MMETALKREREKVKKLSNNEKPQDSEDPKDAARESVNFLKGMWLETVC